MNSSTSATQSSKSVDTDARQLLFDRYGAAQTVLCLVSVSAGASATNDEIFCADCGSGDAEVPQL